MTASSPKHRSSGAASADGPRYRHLAKQLREAVTSGEYAPGARLPTESELARRAGMSRGTVIKAIAELVSEGIVTKRQGAGSFVSLPALHRRSSRLVSFSETVIEQGRKASQRVLSYSAADDEWARAMGAVEPSVELVRLRYVDGVAYAIHRSVVPQRVMDLLPAESLGQLIRGGESNFSLYAAFDAAGVEIERGSEHISARLATAAEAKQLNLATPAALMSVTRQSYGADGRLIEAVEALYDAETYSYDLELQRGVSAAVPHRMRMAT